MKESLEDRLTRIGEEAEAAERIAEPDAPLPPHVKVGRPGRGRSKVLQVRLNPDELAAIEAIAKRRGLPVSTVAREQILQLMAEDAAAQADPMAELLDVADRAEDAAEFIRQFVTTTRAGGDPVVHVVDFKLHRKPADTAGYRAAAERAMRELMAIVNGGDDHISDIEVEVKHHTMPTSPTGVLYHPMANSRHVVPHEGGGWDVKKPGSDLASRHFTTQKEAIDKGRQILKNDGGGLLNIHDQQGKIRAKDTILPGNDPYPPKG